MTFLERKKDAMESRQRARDRAICKHAKHNHVSHIDPPLLAKGFRTHHSEAVMFCFFGMEDESVLSILCISGNINGNCMYYY